ncbi:MAG: hypothetical protein R3C42_02830 [Parvularculaceae bacterium]|nr:hypothetical protein [Parvularculaceae bacterium]
MKRLASILSLMILCACGETGAIPAATGDRARRIVSLDYCADQFVLKFAEKDRILALSPDAGKQFSYMRAAASGIRTVRPLAEDVILLKPDLVVRSYGGGPNAAKFFARAGVPVLEVGWAGDIEAVIANVERMASGLGSSELGRHVADDMRARLADVADGAAGKSALYLTPSGVTTGPGTLIDEMLRVAGLDNYQRESGWRAIPLESLAYRQPDLIAAATFGDGGEYANSWSAMRHPLARRQLKSKIVVPLEGAWTSCGGWFLVDAVEALADGARK